MIATVNVGARIVAQILSECLTRSAIRRWTITADLL